MNTTDQVDLMRTFWLSQSGGGSTGPYTLEQIGSMFRSGAIYATATVCEEGGNSWFPVTHLRSQYPDVFAGFRVTAQQSKTIVPKGPVNVGVYRVLGLLLGCIGAHNFYAGELAAGIWKLLLLVAAILASAISLFASAAILLAVALWAFTEIIQGHQFEMSGGRVSLRVRIWTWVIVGVLIFIILMSFITQ